MSVVTITLRPNGRDWPPRFAQAINDEKCIGCGRCFRVCGRDVLQLVGIDENGVLVESATTTFYVDENEITEVTK